MLHPSMLGPVQKQWLLDGVKNSKADFIFVVSSVNFMVPHIGGGSVRGHNKDDAWTVFFDEREKSDLLEDDDCMDFLDTLLLFSREEKLGLVFPRSMVLLICLNLFTSSWMTENC